MTKKLKGGGGRRVALPQVRELLAPATDIRSSVGFQNDINALIASLEDARPPWRAEASLFAPTQQPSREPAPRAFAAKRPRRAPSMEDADPITLVMNR